MKISANIKKILWKGIAFCLLVALSVCDVGSTVAALDIESMLVAAAEGGGTTTGETPSSQTDNSMDLTRFIGYGYNVAGNNNFFDSENAFNTANPILDMSNSKLTSSIVIQSINRVVSEYQSETNAHAIAESYASSMMVGIDAKVGISMLDLGVNGSFNTQTSLDKSDIVQEKYEIYSMLAKNKVVAISLTASELRDCLTASFVKDLKNVNTEEKAKLFLEKYGTHMPSGYTYAERIHTRRQA